MQEKTLPTWCDEERSLNYSFSWAVNLYFSFNFCPLKHKGIIMSNCCRHYGFLNFMFDVVMTVVTAGLWLIWVFVREMRNR